MHNKREIIKFLESLIKKELVEATTTGNIAGYNTPFAFSDKSSKSKKKKKQNSTNSTGYNIVRK